MNESYIKQHLMVDDYLAGSLSERDLALFEERLLWDTTLVEEVALAEALRLGLREHGVDVTTNVHEFHRETRTHWWSSPVYAIAASVLLAVSLIFNLIQGFDATPDSRGTAADRTPQVVQLIAQRRGEATEIAIDAEGWTVLTMDPVGEFEEFRLMLSALDDSGQPQTPVAVEAGLRAVPTEPLAVSVPGADLPPGDYLLALDARNSEDAEYQRVGAIRFRTTVRP